MKIKFVEICLYSAVFLLSSCNNGSATSSTNPNITISTYNYDPGNKTAVNVVIGGSAPIQAEIDTGSDMTVVNESVVGPNISKTTESITITYGHGQNTVSGYLAYGSVTFTTTTGAKLSSSSESTPILVVTHGSVNEGGGNNAILGMRMDTQLSPRLYLPAPYNQTMILNRPYNQLIFGQLNKNLINNFANIQQVTTPCVNYNVLISLGTNCWGVAENSVNYTVFSQLGVESTYNYLTIFDSGEATASFNFEHSPSWMDYGTNGVILTPVIVTANTSKGLISLPLTSQSYYHHKSDNTVNPGNNLFNYYQVLFDQPDGIIGFADPGLPLN